MAGPQAEILTLVVALTDTTRRRDAARHLARHLRAQDLLVFAPDDEIHVLLPAPHFPQTLPEGQHWQQLLQECLEAKEPRRARLPYPGYEPTPQVLALPGDDGSVLALIGGAPQLERAEQVRRLLPLLAATYRRERAASTAEGHANVAREAAGQARALAEALDHARRDLGRALNQARAARERSLFLAEASKCLAGSLDLEATLASVVRLAVPRLADCALLDLVDEAGLLQRRLIRASAASEDTAESSTTYSLPVRLDASHPIATVARTAEAQLFSAIPAPFWHEPALAAELSQRFGTAALMIVPMVVRGRTLGTLSFLTDNPVRFHSDDSALAEDITARAAAAIDNAQLYQALQEADRRKDEFLAMLAHELRNPLAPIRMGLDVMKSEAPESETLDLMTRQVEHLVRLVDDLLDVSRIMRGKIALRREPVELAQVLQDAVQMIRPLLESRRQHLETDFPHDVWLHADRVRLTQVIGNLLNNASKYSDPGGHVSLRARAEENSVQIHVRDDGIGIDAATLPRVFDLFTQAEQSIDRSQGGLGIGLTVVQSLVEMHGGRVSVHSEGAGFGSEFIVRLPLGSGRLASPAGRGSTGGDVGYRILIVEDSVAAARMLALLLEKIGPHQVELAHDGPTALQVAEQFRPDVMLMDIGLPKIDGYELVRRFRRNPKFEETAIVAITGYGRDEDRHRSREAGFDAHLVKPVSVEDLQDVLNEIGSDGHSR